MRYDTPIYFQKLTPGEYDPATGNYGEDTISEDMKSASVMDTGTNTMMLVYSGIKEGSLTIHLQNHYDRPFDRIRVGNKTYGVDFSGNFGRSRYMLCRRWCDGNQNNWNERVAEENWSGAENWMQLRLLLRRMAANYRQRHREKHQLTLDT